MKVDLDLFCFLVCDFFSRNLISSTILLCIFIVTLLFLARRWDVFSKLDRSTNPYGGDDYPENFLAKKVLRRFLLIKKIYFQSLLTIIWLMFKYSHNLCLFSSLLHDSRPSLNELHRFKHWTQCQIQCQIQCHIPSISVSQTQDGCNIVEISQILTKRLATISHFEIPSLNETYPYQEFRV